MTGPARPRFRVRDIARQTIKAWLSGDAVHWGAALSYYALFSLGPLLLLLVGTAGLVLDARTASATIINQLRPFFGTRGATVAETILREGSFPGFDSPKALVSIALLLLAGTGVFANLRGALNAVWSVRPVSGTLRNLARTRLSAILMMLTLGLLVLASVLLSTAVSVLAPYLEAQLPGGSWLVRALDLAVSTLFLWVAFAATYRILPDAQIAWRDVWVGALATAILFVVGKALIGLYLGRSDLGSAYGAAGSVFLLLVWLYYSAQIFILGATFTQVWARARGRDILPEDYAVRITERTVRPERPDPDRVRSA